ncbi:MAG: hypothetical protein AVDCRST_MAG62-958 [uncultured Sphingomonas sp.]|uniref:Uncharacterized protein n=1 Tax=uncultured Sphingomonas sp. TaxID=158754 RepID=A0A6J4TB59_9SPHN|nr:MAG: hypothetical protein AVDCRST_MAG62-958 [uncultured Sphingomonas sp.]
MSKFNTTGIVSALLLASPLLLASTPVHAKQNVQREVAAGQGGAAADKADKKICRRLELTGSRMAKTRFCHTAEEWKKIEEMN